MKTCLVPFRLPLFQSHIFLSLIMLAATIIAICTAGMATVSSRESAQEYLNPREMAFVDGGFQEKTWKRIGELPVFATQTIFGNLRFQDDPLERILVPSSNWGLFVFELYLSSINGAGIVYYLVTRYIFRYSRYLLCLLYLVSSL